RTTWESFLTVPAELTAVSNGSLVGVEAGPRPGTRTFHYKMAEPNVTYLIAVAVGPWERYADAWQGRPVEYFVPRGTGAVTARGRGQGPPLVRADTRHDRLLLQARHRGRLSVAEVRADRGGRVRGGRHGECFVDAADRLDAARRALAPGPDLGEPGRARAGAS